MGEPNSGHTPMYPPRLSQTSATSWGASNASYGNGFPPAAYPGAMQPTHQLHGGGAPGLPPGPPPGAPGGAYQTSFPPPSPAPGQQPASSGVQLHQPPPPPHGAPYYGYGAPPAAQPSHSFPMSAGMSVSGGLPRLPAQGSMSLSYASSMGGSVLQPPSMPPSLAPPSMGTPQMHAHPHPPGMGAPVGQQLPPGAAIQGTPVMAPQQQPTLMTHNSIFTPTSTFSGAPAGVAHVQASEVKLEISCKSLRDRDVISKSDPCAVVFLEEKRLGAPSGYPGHPTSRPSAHQPSYSNVEHAPAASPNEVTHWREVGRTESIKDNLNPHFSVHVTVPYRFEELQNIRIGIWDIDTRHKELHTHDFLGDIRTTLGDLVASGITEKPLNSQNYRDHKTLLGGKRNLGSITIIVHETRDGGKLLVKGRFTGKKLAKRDLFSSDPYLIFTQLAMRGAHSRSQVHVTEVVPRNRNPVWKPVKFKVDLPKGGTHSHIKLEILCNDKDHMSCDDEIGIANCTLEELLIVGNNQGKLPLIYSKKKGRRGYKDSGQLIVKDVSAVRMPSLIEYLQGGLKLHFSVAVDLTASNGDPRDPTSLHYLAPGYPNEYVRALSTIGGVLQHYAPNDGMFKAYGFGAELPGQAGVASSCFPLNLGHDARCQGIDGIISAYQRVLQTVRLSGPTNFSPLVEEATRTALGRENTIAQQNYDVLLILTDGVVTDFNRTVERIIDASMSAPLSIIIIGVGRANFDKMERLDADNQLLASVDGRRVAARDIVQFVPLRDFAHQPPDRLASSVLAELPENIVDYFISRSPAIMPGQVPMRPDQQQVPVRA